MSADRNQELAKHNYWGELLKLRDEQRERVKNAIQVVRGESLPQEVNQQGLMRWYLHPSIKDTILSTLMFFEQEIPPAGRTGRLKFGGGQVIYILEGKGYTLVDGVKHPWEAGDVLNLPLRKEGIVIQHVNESSTDRAKFVAAEPNFFECTTVDRGCGFEQIEDAPEYRKK